MKKQITLKQLDSLILKEVEKKDPMEAQREAAEEQKFEKIKKLQEFGEKIHGQINNSFEHLNAFMSLGTKTRDTFEYTRAVAEIGRIQKLTANMATLISKAHEIAESEPEIQESPYDSEKMAQMAAIPPRSRIVNPNVQRKDSPMSMGLQEYGVIAEHFGTIKTFDVKAQSASEALLKVRKEQPAWEVKKIISLGEQEAPKTTCAWCGKKYLTRTGIDTKKCPYCGHDNAQMEAEAPPVKGSKPPLFPDDDKEKKFPKPKKERPFKEPPSGAEVPAWAKDIYEEL